MTLSWLITLSIASVYVVVDAKGHPSSLECDSFYDYVCNLDETLPGTKSYFELLRNRHVKTMETILTNVDLFDRCMRRANEPSSLEALIASSMRNDNSTYRVNFMENKKRSNAPPSFYSVLWTVESVERNGFGVDFPVKVQVTKRLDSLETCLDVSPNVKWLNAAHDAITSDAFVSLPDRGVKKPLIDFVRKLKETFDVATTIVDEGNDEIEDYLKRYATIATYDASTSPFKSQFWKDVLMNLFDVKDASFCVHTNGYERYYAIVEKYVTFPITSDVDFLETLDAFSQDVKFGKFSTTTTATNSSTYALEKEQKTRCEKIVRKAIPRTMNDAFLTSTGMAEAFERDFSVETMLRELKKAINDTVFESTHLPLEFKLFASTKLRDLKAFVINKRSPLKIDDDVKESVCFDAYALDAWSDVMECLTDRKALVEKDIVKKASRSDVKEYGYATTYLERYEYLYENTDLSIVNAWYDPTKNEITIPAGIAFWPMYSGNAFDTNDMYDYSRMGMILAHELGHALDAHGLCWDERGNYDVTKRYCADYRLPALVKQNMECLMNDYGHPCGTDDGYGERTLGEDMADQLGVTAAWKVFVEKYGDVLRLEDEREFFRKYAQLWCEGKHPKIERMRSIKTTILEDASDVKNEYEDGVGKKSNLPFALERVRIAKHYKTISTVVESTKRGTKTMDEERWMCDRVMNDVHALPKHRVNKSLRQFRTFSKVFACDSDSKMYKETPCVIY